MGHADLGARIKRFFSRSKRENASTPARAVDQLPSPRRAIFEEVEARILFSADLAPGISDGASAEVRVIDSAADAAAPAVVTYQQQGDAWVNPYSDPYADNSAAPTAAAAPEQAVAQQPTHEIVFVDSAVEDQDELVRGILQNNPGAEIVRLDGSLDGIAQITNALAGKQDISAIHLITHGSAGTLQIGASWLNEQSMALYADSIASWRSALTDDADILLYGCDLAGTADGRALADDISALSGADVAASQDKTGQAEQGGNWALEYSTGRIESAIAVDAATQQDWNHTLDVALVNTTSGSTGGSGNKLKAEFSSEKHVRGTVSMARAQSPDSADSQFFICFAPAPALNGKYTVFGQVTAGMEYIDAIKKGDPDRNGVVSDPDKIVRMQVAADADKAGH